jgi:hypothetical protein
MDQKKEVFDKYGVGWGGRDEEEYVVVTSKW